MSMLMNINVIGADIIAQEIEDSILTDLHNLALKTWTNLVVATPVDTGSASASWDIAESESEIKEFEYSEFNAVTELPNINEKAENFVVGSRSEYMEFLNEGSSDQAPSGFVEMAVQEAIDELF